MDGPPQQVFLWNKIGVQNTNEFTFRSFQAYRQRACFETSSINPVNVLNIKTTLSQFRRARGDNLAGFVG
jgi:hypothetical protein